MPWPAAISGIIGAAATSGSEIGSVLYSNHMNYVNTQRTNEANERINERQLQFARDMWEAENEYNDPSNVRSRLQAAGINPNLYYSKNAVAPAQLQSAPSQIAMQSPPPYEGFSLRGGAEVASSIADAALKDAQKDNIQEDTRTRAIDNIFEYDKQLNSLYEQRAHIYNMKVDSKQKSKMIDEIDERIKTIALERDYAVDMYRARNDEMRESANLRREQVLGQQLTNSYQKMVNTAFPTLNAAQINALNASTTDAYAQADLHYNMSATECEKQANLVTERQLTRLQKEGVEIDNENQKKLGRANLHYIRTLTHKVRNTDNFVQNYSPLIGAGGSIGSAAVPHRGVTRVIK